MTRKAQKFIPWSNDAFDQAAADLRNRTPRPPRSHLIVLTGPFDTAETIRRIARLSETPAIESTKTIPQKDGETSRMVSFCRVDDSGLLSIFDWASERGYCVLPQTPVVFGKEKGRHAIEAYFDESLLEKGDQGFSDEGE